jgi:energy-converting hydrogenase Eha subunit F
VTSEGESTFVTMNSSPVTTTIKTESTGSNATTPSESATTMILQDTSISTVSESAFLFIAFVNAISSCQNTYFYF